MRLRLSRSKDLYGAAFVSCVLCLGSVATAETLPPAGTQSSGETLHYNINWPSGLSLGEATIQASGSGIAAGIVTETHWDFSAMLDAAIPGFSLRDEYRSESDGKFCSTKLEKTVTRGSRKTTEKVTIDQAEPVTKRVCVADQHEKTV